MENFTPVADSVFTSFEIDQSYLPSIIKRLGVTFAKAQP